MITGRLRDAEMADLIKLEDAVSKNQSEIEEITAHQKGLDQRVDTEGIAIRFTASASVDDDISPIRKAWEGSSATLSRNTGYAITATIASLPWIFPGIIALLILRFGIGYLRRGRSK